MYHLGFLFYFSSTATADNIHAREVVKKEFRTMENMGQRVRALRVAQGDQLPLTNHIEPPSGCDERIQHNGRVKRFARLISARSELPGKTRLTSRQGPRRSFLESPSTGLLLVSTLSNQGNTCNAAIFFHV